MTEAPPPEIEEQRAADGYPIQVGVWPVEQPRGRIVVLHGVQSHFGWYGGLGRRLADAGYETHMPDRRGSGHNLQARGDTPGMNPLLQDIHDRLIDLRSREPRVPVALAGISWGGKLAVVAAGRRPDLVDGLALICPGLTPRVGVSVAERLRIAMARVFRPTSPFLIPLADPALFTANPEAQAFIAADPLSLRAASARLMAASSLLDVGVRRRLRNLPTPTLLMTAGRDRIVDNDRTRTLMDRSRLPMLERIHYPDAHHTLEFEADPARYAADLVAWLDSVFKKATA